MAAHPQAKADKCSQQNGFDANQQVLGHRRGAHVKGVRRRDGHHHCDAGKVGVDAQQHVEIGSSGQPGHGHRRRKANQQRGPARHHPGKGVGQPRQVAIFSARTWDFLGHVGIDTRAGQGYHAAHRPGRQDPQRAQGIGHEAGGRQHA